MQISDLQILIAQHLWPGAVGNELLLSDLWYCYYWQKQIKEVGQTNQSVFLSLMCVPLQVQVGGHIVIPKLQVSNLNAIWSYY